MERSSSRVVVTGSSLSPQQRLARTGSTRNEIPDASRMVPAASAALSTEPDLTRPMKPAESSDPRERGEHRRDQVRIGLGVLLLEDEVQADVAAVAHRGEGVVLGAVARHGVVDVEGLDAGQLDV